MARNQQYFGPNDPAHPLSRTEYLEVTNGPSSSISIAVLSGEIEFRGFAGSVPVATARGFPMVKGDVMIKRPLADLFGDPAINRVAVKAIGFQSEILVDATDA